MISGSPNITSTDIVLYKQALTDNRTTLASNCFMILDIARVIGCLLVIIIMSIFFNSDCLYSTR